MIRAIITGALFVASYAADVHEFDSQRRRLAEEGVATITGEATRGQACVPKKFAESVTDDTPTKEEVCNLKSTLKESPPLKCLNKTTRQECPNKTSKSFTEAEKKTWGSTEKDQKKKLLEDCECRIDGDLDKGKTGCKKEEAKTEKKDTCKIGLVCKAGDDETKDCESSSTDCKCYKGTASIRRAIYALLFLGIASF